MSSPLGSLRTAWILAAFASSACVMPEHGEVVAAREAWETCVEAESEAHDDCRLLQERLRIVQRRYEERARSAWGCDPAREACVPRRADARADGGREETPWLSF